VQVLLVFSHPVETSFAASLRDTVQKALVEAGHSVDLLDLYAEGFEGILSRQDRLDYHDTARNRDRVASHVERLHAADALVLVFPTWWYGMPAMLRGWFERVWLPGVAFGIDARGLITTGELAKISKIGVVTTSGSPWWLIHLYLGNPLRRLIGRGLRRLCARGCSLTWLQHYSMDRSTPESRAAFLAKVERTFRAF
jgi:putative NADPH-quinone reductase